MSEFNNIGLNDKIDFNTKDGGEYLFFYLKNELYAIDIFKVSEIIECSNITAIPIMNDFIDGISSVRGNLIPIVNLHARLDFDKTKKTNKSSIIVVKKEHQQEILYIGVLVDEVYEVDGINSLNIKQAPIFGLEIN